MKKHALLIALLLAVGAGSAFAQGAPGQPTAKTNQGSAPSRSEPTAAVSSGQRGDLCISMKSLEQAMLGNNAGAEIEALLSGANATPCAPGATTPNAKYRQPVLVQIHYAPAK